MFFSVSNYDKQQWQAEQAARDAHLSKQREKWAKAKERSARNAQRKLKRLSSKLSEEGKLTDWEVEFTGSVTERLDKFGSAFQDPEKGRPSDALSFAQKKVMSALNKKVKDGKKTSGTNAKARKPLKAKSGFKNKNYTPRVRQLDEDFEPDIEPVDNEPFIPEISPSDTKPPFLRVVK